MIFSLEVGTLQAAVKQIAYE